MGCGMVRAVQHRRGLFAAAAGILICASGMGLAWLTGCVLFVPVTKIEDLQFEGIDHVAVEDVDEGQDGGYLQVTAPGDLQRVKLSTQESLSGIIQRRQLDYARVEIFFCDEGAKERKIENNGWVYVGADRLRAVQRSNYPSDLPRAEDGRYVYSILFDRPAPIYQSEWVNGQRPQLGTVDIEAPAKPVCLQIYVSEYWFGRVVKTNIVPLQTLADAAP